MQNQKNPLPKGRRGLSTVFALQPSYLIPVIRDSGRKLCVPTFRKVCPWANDSLNAMIRCYFSIVLQIICLELPEASRILIPTDDFSAKVRYVGMILAIAYEKGLRVGALKASRVCVHLFCRASSHTWMRDSHR